MFMKLSYGVFKCMLETPKFAFISTTRSTGVRLDYNEEIATKKNMFLKLSLNIFWQTERAHFSTLGKKPTHESFLHQSASKFQGMQSLICMCYCTIFKNVCYLNTSLQLITECDEKWNVPLYIYPLNEIINQIWLNFCMPLNQVVTLHDVKHF